LGEISPAELEAAFRTLEQDASRVMQDTLTPGAKYGFERAADIRFVGQGFEIVTRLPDGPFDESTPARIRAEFAASYARVFGQVPPVQDIELINLRLTAIEQLVDRPLTLDGAGKEIWKIGSDKREVWNEQTRQWQTLKVFARETLAAGQVLTGPLIIEDASSTLLVPAGASAIRDSSGNLVIELPSQASSGGEAAFEELEAQ
jgi:N-methylhydantoinase A